MEVKGRLPEFVFRVYVDHCATFSAVAERLSITIITTLSYSNCVKKCMPWRSAVKQVIQERYNVFREMVEMLL